MIWHDLMQYPLQANSTTDALKNASTIYAQVPTAAPRLHVTGLFCFISEMLTAKHTVAAAPRALLLWRLC